jgi:flagellar biosynthesis protein FlhF
VLPAGLQGDLVRRTVPLYRRYGATHLLVTKLDECPEDWTPFDVAAEERLPMRWITDGQEVPRDLRAAAPRLLAAVASLRVRNAVPAESLA